jgi:hypothetical protein
MRVTVRSSAYAQRTHGWCRATHQHPLQPVQAQPEQAPRRRASQPVRGARTQSAGHRPSVACPRRATAAPAPARNDAGHAASAAACRRTSTTGARRTASTARPGRWHPAPAPPAVLPDAGRTGASPQAGRSSVHGRASAVAETPGCRKPFWLSRSVQQMRRPAVGQADLVSPAAAAAVGFHAESWRPYRYRARRRRIPVLPRIIQSARSSCRSVDTIPPSCSWLHAK